MPEYPKDERSKATEQVPKLLVIERKLALNRGHHHTQISGLKYLFPSRSISFIAGEAYDDFLGVAAGKLADESFKLTRLRARLKFGNVIQRMSAFMTMLKAGRFSLPASAYGQYLIDVSQQMALGSGDLIIVPTAELASLESVLEMCRVLEDAAPRVCLRFLDSELGERDFRIRQRRLREATANMPSSIALFSETEELADYLRRTYGINITGRFYLPCSMQLEDVPRSYTDMRTFRIGVFGAPRAEKGCGSIAAIVQELAKLRASNADRPIEFLVQGSEEDFGENGVYGGLVRNLRGQDFVTVSRHSDKLSPLDFRELFGSVEAVILPYDISVYNLQGSGVIQDAVASHKLVIYKEGMAMADDLLSHGNSISATNERDFADAIITAASGISNLDAALKRAADHFKSALKNSPIYSVEPR